MPRPKGNITPLERAKKWKADNPGEGYQRTQTRIISLYNQGMATADIAQHVGVVERYVLDRIAAARCGHMPMASPMSTRDVVMKGGHVGWPVPYKTWVEAFARAGFKPGDKAFR